MKKRMKFDKTIAPVFVLNQTEWDQSQPFIRAFIQTSKSVRAKARLRCAWLARMVLTK